LTGDPLILANEDFSFKTSDFEATLPMYTVYEDMKLEYTTSQMKYSYAPLHHFHNDDVPVQQLFVLKLKTKPMDTTLTSKAVVVEVSKDNKKIYSKGGQYTDGWMTTQVKSFGKYTVRVDSIGPKVMPIHFKDSSCLDKTHHIQWKITDNLSGIKQYSVFVNDEWKLAFYNTKTDVLTLPFDEYNAISFGDYKLRIVVTDERKNTTEHHYTFYR
jgi:hypothetical protein